MPVCTCPNCGHSIEIHGFMSTKVKCKSCKASFGVEYEDENGTVYSGGWKGFSQKHPNFIKGLGWTVAGVMFVVGTGLAIASKFETLAESSHAPEDSSGTGTDDPSCIPEQQAAYHFDDYDDQSASSFDSECCRTCGIPLAGSDYTLPWEDDDNDLGYWKCDNCGAINYDWNSGDD